MRCTICGCSRASASSRLAASFPYLCAEILVSLNLIVCSAGVGALGGGHGGAPQPGGAAAKGGRSGPCVLHGTYAPPTPARSMQRAVHTVAAILSTCNVAGGRNFQAPVPGARQRQAGLQACRAVPSRAVPGWAGLCCAATRPASSAPMFLAAPICTQKDRALFPGADPREFWQRRQAEEGKPALRVVEPCTCVPAGLPCFSAASGQVQPAGTSV